MKRILILIFVICFTAALKAQQLPQITQYMNNNYAINPAVSGMYDYYQVNTIISNQSRNGRFNGITLTKKERHERSNAVFKRKFFAYKRTRRLGGRL